MPEYVRKIFDLVQNGEYVYYKLVIDGKCQFDEFLEKVDNIAKVQGIVKDYSTNK